MAAQWGALLWLDWRLLVNRVRTIARNPRRFVPWLIFLVWLLPSFITRLTLRNRIGRTDFFPAVGPQLEPLGALLPGVALLILGISVWRASMTAPAAFQSPADARFVIGAGLDSRAVFTWLSLRTARRLILSFALMLVVIQVLYLPWLGFSFVSAFAFSLAIATYLGIVFGARLLAFTLQRAAPAIPVGFIGLLATVAGGAMFLAALLQLLGVASVPDGILAVNAALPPGSWIVTAMGGNYTGELALLAAAVALTAAGIALAGDCYPELWATSSRAMALRRAMRGRGGLFGYSARARRAAAGAATAPRRVESVAGEHVPPGAMTVFWKEWIAVRRGRGGVELQLGLLVAAVVLGWLIGYSTSQSSHIAPVVGTVAVALVILRTWSAGIQLGRDVGNPLWWLSSSALWSRLVVWTVARALRFGLPLVVFIEFVVVGAGANPWLLLAAPVPPLLLSWMSQTVGLAVYALLPARTDFRLQMTLRSMSVYAIFIVIAVAAAPGLLLRNFVVAATAPAVAVAAVIAVTLVFATWRIEGNGIVFAQEERQ
jgi:hypothetical protein